MKNIKEVFSDIIGYRDFKKGPDEQQKSFLFWDLFILKCVFGIVVLTLIFKYNVVFADVSNPGTYLDVPANTCVSGLYSSNSYYSVESTSDSRIVCMHVIGTPANYSCSIVSISATNSDKYSTTSASSSVSCNSPQNSGGLVTTLSYNGTDFKAFGLSTGYTYFGPVVEVPNSGYLNYEYAFRYSYGDLVSSPAGYVSVAANYCFDFGINSNVHRSISGNIPFRAVNFTNGTNTRTYFVFVYDSSAEYKLDTTGSSCNASASSSSISRIIVDGVQYGYFYSSYNGDSSFPAYSTDSYSASDAVAYTFGSNAVQIASLPEVLDYSVVEQIYPPENNSILRDYSSYFNRLNTTDNYSLGLYLTRYVKDLDLIAAYYLAFQPDNEPAPGYSRGGNDFAYSYSSSGLTINFNEVLKTSGGITSVFDYDFLDFYTPTNHLTKDLSHQDDGNTYGLIYPKLNDPSLLELYFTMGNPAATQAFTYSDLDLPSSISLTPTQTPYIIQKISTEQDQHNLILYTAVVDSDDYYDFYVLMSLSAGSSVSGIYNDGLYLDSESGVITDLTFYNVMDYLGLNPHPTFGINTVVEDRNSLDELENGTYDPDLIDRDNTDNVPTEEEYIGFTYSGLYAESFNQLKDILTSDSDSINQVYYSLIENGKYFDIALNDIYNVNFLSSFDFISTQLEGIYHHTILSVLINLALVVLVILSIIF